MKNEYFATAIILFAMTFSAQVAHSQQTIAFEGIENARDIGTLVMHNGQVVRSGMLVRSGCLAKATDSDVAVLKEKYRLSDVFDFRFEAEVNAAPDRIIDGVSYTHLSTLPKALIEGFASSGRSDTAHTDTKNMAAVLMKYAFEPKSADDGPTALSRHRDRQPGSVLLCHIGVRIFCDSHEVS